MIAGNIWSKALEKKMRVTKNRFNIFSLEVINEYFELKSASTKVHLIPDGQVRLQVIQTGGNKWKLGDEEI